MHPCTFFKMYNFMRPLVPLVMVRTSDADSCIKNKRYKIIFSQPKLICLCLFNVRNLFQMKNEGYPKNKIQRDKYFSEFYSKFHSFVIKKH